MDRKFTPIVATLFATVGGQTLMQNAQAQTTADAAALPEVTVSETNGSPLKADTASSTKFTAPLLDTPKTVTVITSEVMSQTGSTSLVEALRTTPGITFGAGEGGNPVGDRPFIRGFDAQSSTYIDGMRDLGSQSREVFDVESIEVVKGASSAMGGGGSTGGSVNIVSKAPKKEQFSSGSIGVGTDNYKRLTADGNYLLGDNAAIRLNAMYHDSGVAGRDAIYNNRWGFAPSLTLGINSPTRVTFSYYHMQSDDLPDSGIPYNNPKTGDARNGDGSPYVVNRNTYYGLADRDFHKTQADIGTVKVEHDFDATLHVKNTTRYSRTVNDYLWTQPDDSQGNTYNGKVWRRANSRYSVEHTLQNQTELFGEFTTGAIKHSFSTGIELSREESMKDSYLVATSTAAAACAGATGAASKYNCTSLYNPDSSDPWSGYVGRANRPTNAANNTYSVYAFDNIELTKQWSVNLGLRVDSYHATSSTAAYAAVSAAASPSGVAQSAVAASNLSNNSTLVNYQTGVVFKPTQNGSVYVNYSTSSDPAGLNTNDGTSDGSLSAANQNLDPELSKSYELGTKWDVMDNKLSLTAALFRTEKTNARVTQADGTTQLAGNYKVDGIELGFAGNVTNKLQVFGGYTFMNSKIVNGGTSTSGSATNGKQMANIPRNSYSLWSTYMLLPKLTVGGGAFYTSKIYGNTANTKWVPGYTRFDAMASYVINKNMNLQLNIQNLSNKIYYSQAYASHYATLAAGRSATLALNVKY
jgi:catecholate siderophore receptor